MEVMLLTQEQCASCDAAKTILERLAGEYPLSVATLDLASEEGQRLAARGGVLFPPGVFLGGEPFSYGRLSERKLRRELDRRLRA
ncbi:MAG: glutaredoxin family protein [Actinobacteria bacterium]|nr:glutaredoxin family protein [Actinomycetota bacterium]